MLNRFSDRTLEIATTVAVVITALVLLCYGSIFVAPQVPWNPFKPPTDTPAPATAIAQEPTWTPSPTPTATSTGTPTPTWTPTATPTWTPTPTPTWTPTPTPTLTSTPKPPPPPPKPKPPTATPTPWPYEYSGAGARGNCTFTGVYGYVLDAGGLPEGGVLMRAGNNQGWKTDATTDANGFYVIKFWDGPKEGMWFVRVFKGGEPRSEQFWWRTSGACDGPYSLQEVQIDWRHR